jgi:predicted ATP-dependent endonuclease of OLD family
MQLKSVKITNFRSIEDSTEFDVGNLTCLVGKNEAGKTAILHAIYGLNPVGDFKYDRVKDYPRRYLSKFEERHPNGESKVVKSIWQLEKPEIDAIHERFGPQSLVNTTVEYSSAIGARNGYCSVQMDETACIEFVKTKHNLDTIEKKPLKDVSSTKELIQVLENLATRSDRQNALLTELQGMRDRSFRVAAIDVIHPFRPKFLYTSHFERMSGEISLTKLTTDKQNNTVSVGDKIFLDFLEYAGTSLEELQSSTKYEELKAKCEAASNDITDEIFEFWSQNEALSVKIELTEGKAEDMPPFNSGTVALIRIENSNHRATVPLSERSAGFIWFFSFLSQFKQLKKSSGNAVLLLDEPGLTLHGKAQADLLRYIQDRLLPEHQVIYSTHSPFMVPANRLADVRVVEDVVDKQNGKTIVKGTKVSADILSVDKATIFPLQAHLGYEITQSLFIGKNTLLVEGPSDILYLQAFSNELKRRKRKGLDARWAVCPSGGIDKIWPFASLFGGNKLNIAVLCDYGTGDKGKVQKLRQGEILKSNQIFTASDFSGKAESDIEDFLTDELYAHIVNEAYGLAKKDKLQAAKLGSATSGQIRIVKAVEDAFRLLPAGTPDFDHFTPANWLLTTPNVLSVDSPMVNESLDKFEAVFQELNKLIVES